MPNHIYGVIDIVGARFIALKAATTPNAAIAPDAAIARDAVIAPN